MSVCGVYEIKNKVNGKVYIGQSMDVLRRWRQHRHRLDEGSHLNAHLQAAWKIHGADAFSFQTVRVCEPDYLGSAEKEVLEKVPPELRYNLGPAGDSPTRGLKYREETRQRMSNAKGGRPVIATKVETGEEIRFPYLQKAVDCLNLCQAHASACCHRRRETTKGWRLRFDESVEQPSPPSKSEKPKHAGRRSREIVGIHVETGEEVYFSHVSAVRERGFIRESVIKCLSGEMNKHKEYFWKYADGLPHGTLDASWKQKLRKPRNKGSSVSKPVVGRKLDTGEETTYSYIAEAARSVGCPPCYISLCLSGRLKAAGGCTWRRANP